MPKIFRFQFFSSKNQWHKYLFSVVIASACDALLRSLFSLGPDKSYQNSSAFCAVLQLMQTIYLTPSHPPTDACFLSLPDICSFTLFWGRPGSDRPSTHSCRGPGQAPTTSFTDSPFFPALHSSPELPFILPQWGQCVTGLQWLTAATCDRWVKILKHGPGKWKFWYDMVYFAWPCFKGWHLKAQF